MLQFFYLFEKSQEIHVGKESKFTDMSPVGPRIQRAWRARMSRRGSWQGQDESLTSHHQGETVPSESQQQDPGMTTDISPVRAHQENPTDDHMVQHENEAGGERSRHL